MRYFLMYDTSLFKLEMWSGGLSYALTYKPDGSSVFVQGDDANQFREELDAHEARYPDLAPEQLCAFMWDEMGYGMAATND